MFFFWGQSLLSGHFETSIEWLPAYQSSSQILTITTTSRSSVWSPANVITNGEVLEWTASADGMTDQVIRTSGIPTFDLSLNRNSDVAISISQVDGKGELIELIANSLNITSITFVNANSMQKLSCTDNQIKDLNLSNSFELRELYCHSNQLTQLDVSNCEKLSILACFSNQITDLNLDQNGLLASLSCSNNLIKGLDLSMNVNLNSLECRFNNLEFLDIKNGNNTIITKFDTGDNPALLCIEVDDKDYSDTNWNSIDPWTEFSEDCTFTNNPPLAIDDEYETNEDTELVIDEANGVLSNDIDPDDDPLIANLQEDVSNGRLELNPDGSFVYQPNPGYSGTDSFSYSANDGEFDSNIARVLIKVLLVNSPPIATDDSYSTIENQGIVINAENGVLANDLDPDNDELTASLLSVSGKGTMILNDDGSFSYAPPSDFYGIDTFSYRAFDGIEFSNTAEIAISVESINEIIPPTAFTPNGDGLNDTFRPVYRGMENVELKVFDTWGNLIYFESGPELAGWNGLIKGSEAENGNYLYRIIAKTISLETVKLEGIFTLIR
jgi:gliding motility-associated-like protein